MAAYNNVEASDNLNASGVLKAPDQGKASDQGKPLDQGKASDILEAYSISGEELRRLTGLVLAELRLRLPGQSHGPEKGWEPGNRSWGWEPGNRGGEWKQENCGWEGQGKRRLRVLGKLSSEEAQILKSSYSLEFEDREAQASKASAAPEFGEPDGEWDSLLLTELSPETMAYAANGMFGNREASCILWGLLLGRKIFLLQRGLSYRSYRESASKNLYSLYLQQEDTLRNLGVEVIRQVSEMEAGMRAAFPEPGDMAASGRSAPEIFGGRQYEGQPDDGALRERAEKCLDLSGLHLLREADLFRVRSMGPASIKIGRKTIVTPLAMDFIVNHGLSVVRSER